MRFSLSHNVSTWKSMTPKWAVGCLLFAAVSHSAKNLTLQLPRSNKASTIRASTLSAENLTLQLPRSNQASTIGASTLSYRPTPPYSLDCQSSSTIKCDHLCSAIVFHPLEPGDSADTQKSSPTVSEPADPFKPSLEKSLPTVLEPADPFKPSLEKSLPTVLEPADPFKPSLEKSSPTVLEPANPFKPSLEKSLPTVLEPADPFKPSLEKSLPTVLEPADPFKPSSPTVLEPADPFKPSLEKSLPTVLEPADPFKPSQVAAKWAWSLFLAPRKKLADRFGTGRSDLNGAQKTDCRPFWNRPIRFKRSINNDHQLFSNQTASPTAPQDSINNIQI
ncbi:hypothetical protein PGT21_011481 [Puccinia graminis f. sp. tritici]|uniref:Uncharacterized protein n=1 Tax=Puccinia graminis f. sp. tritici TaxID=56615 RepID=A0A5B0QFP8_PUCGR|nr:hypothetical protein PGT21_011481 [Puccinia graminis f. sp. tritici]